MTKRSARKSTFETLFNTVFLNQSKDTPDSAIVKAELL
jgi:hypothetical protein